MTRCIPFTAVLLAALAGASTATAQPIWEESADSPGADRDERRVEVRVFTQDDDSQAADDERPRQHRTRAKREGGDRGLRAGPGQPRVLILDDDDAPPREARKAKQRRGEVREFRMRNGGDNRGPVEIRIDGPRGPGPAGGEDRDIIIRRRGEGRGDGGPQIRHFAFPGGEGQIMIFRDGPGGLADRRDEAGPEARELRIERGGRAGRGEPHIMMFCPRNDGDGPEPRRFRIERGNGDTMILRPGPGGDQGNIFFRRIPGPGGPGEDHEIIIRRGGDDEAPRRLRIQRMQGSDGEPQPGSCPNCNCI